MRVKIAVPPWIARDLEPFVDTRVRLAAVKAPPQGQQDWVIELIVSDKAVAHPPRREGTS